MQSPLAYATFVLEESATELFAEFYLYGFRRRYSMKAQGEAQLSRTTCAACLEETATSRNVLTLLPKKENLSQQLKLDKKSFVLVHHSKDKHADS